MDIYEKVKSLTFSLKTICAVNVVHRIIDSVGVKRKADLGFEEPKIPELLNTKTSKRVEKLNLPTRLKELLAGLIIPIYRELDAWHNQYQFEITPSWTPYGTLDWVRSSKTVVDDPHLKTHYRFKAACTFCHERQILELAEQLTNEDMEEIDRPDLNRSSLMRLYFSLTGIAPPKPHNQPTNQPFHTDHFDFGDQSRDHLWRRLTEFWMRHVRRGGLHLPKDMCDGIDIAIDTRNEVAATYFLGKGVSEWVLKPRFNSEGQIRWDSLSPATCCLLFSKISDQDLRLSFLDEFVYILLDILVWWPYQPLFLDVAHSLALHASDKTLSEVLERIVSIPVEGYRDFDYRGLFVGFYDIIASVNPGWSISKQFNGFWFALSTLQTEDEFWMNFVFRKYSDREKESLLIGDLNGILLMLIFLRKFHLLEPLIRLCWMNRMDLLLKIDDALRLPSDMSLAKSNGESNASLGRRMISSIVDKIVAEQATANDSATSR